MSTGAVKHHHTRTQPVRFFPPQLRLLSPKRFDSAFVAGPSSAVFVTVVFNSPSHRHSTAAPHLRSAHRLFDNNN